MTIFEELLSVSVHGILCVRGKLWETITISMCGFDHG